MLLDKKYVVCLYLSKKKLRPFPILLSVSVIRGTVNITLTAVKPNNSLEEAVKPADTCSVYDSDVEFKNNDSKKLLT